MALLDTSARTTSRPPARIVGAVWLTVSLHLALVVIISVIARRQDTPATTSAAVVRQLPDMVWLVVPGPSGGTNGGNDGMEPPAQAKRPGTRDRTVPARAPRSSTRRNTQEPPAQEINIPALREASNLQEALGVLTAVSMPATSSRAPGSGPGTDGGDGPGLGRGSGKYAGDGPGGPGSNILPPELISQVRPNYTSAALQARVRGIVGMEAIVLPDGSVGEVRVVRSLDRSFGLDQEAIKAVKLWRFRPATQLGKAVPIYVSIEMTFELR